MTSRQLLVPLRCAARASTRARPRRFASSSQHQGPTPPSAKASGKGSSNGESGVYEKFWKWTTKHQPEHEKWSAQWWKEKTVLCTVFAITGSSSMYFVRPVLPKIGLEGSFKEGPWTYRIGSLLVMSPLYTTILLVVGTLAGRHNFFAAMARTFHPQETTLLQFHRLRFLRYS